MDNNKISSFLFANSDDSQKRFGIRQNENVYSKDSAPAKDVFQKRMARLYHCDNIICNHTFLILDLMIVALASGNEKIAVHRNCFPALWKTLRYVSELHSIKIAEFTDLFSLEDALKSGVKAVFSSSACVECNCPPVAQTADMAHSYHVPVIIDNTVTTPCIVNPLRCGADLVLQFSDMISALKTKNSYLTVLDNNHFDWSYQNKYIRIFPFLKYAAPFRAYLNFKCKKTAPVLTKENQSEFFMLCEGLKSLDSRMHIHSDNCKTVMKILEKYAVHLTAQTFENGNAMFVKTEIKQEFSASLQSALRNITAKNIEQLYEMYSCTSVFFEKNTLYVQCGTEPETYLQQFFTSVQGLCP